MKKNLFDFSKEKIQPKTTEKNDDKQTQTTENEIKDKINQYSGKTENELLNELFQKVSQEKQNGTFEINKIKDVYQRLEPYLSEQQRQNIKGLMEKIE